jgi:hypothetical protein
MESWNHIFSGFPLGYLSQMCYSINEWYDRLTGVESIFVYFAHCRCDYVRFPHTFCSKI